MTTPPTAPTKYGKFEVTNAGAAATWGYCFLFTGAKGAGKTSLAASAADSLEDSPVCMVDVEGGAKAISHRPEVAVIETARTWDDLKELVANLKVDPHIPWRTLIWDNLSEIIQLATIKVVGNATDQTSQPKFGDMAREVEAWLRDIRDLARLRGLNSIVISWDDVEEDKAHRTRQTLQATPMLQRDVPGIVDIVGHIDVIDGFPDRRQLVFEPSTRTINKFRRNTSDTGKTVPHRIDYTVDNYPLPDIFAALKRGVPFPTNKYVVAPVPAVRS